LELLLESEQLVAQHLLLRLAQLHLQQSLATVEMVESQQLEPPKLAELEALFQQQEILI
tara:strand:+ start:104 stop:280 length:177 start_codon:yes stop_codon:yes gene_type:complete